MCRGQDLKETALSLEAHAMVVEMASSTPTTDWQPDETTLRLNLSKNGNSRRIHGS